MIKFLKKFEQLSTSNKTILCALILLVITYLDIITGAEISFSIFYLIPIALITWTAGKKPGIIFSISGAVLWFIADDLGGRIYSYNVVLIWNTLVRFGFFLIVTLILTTVKTQKRAEEEFTHFLVHDLRSPLSSILSSLKILREDSFDDDVKSRNEIIDLGIASGKRMIMFINSLLDLERLENKKMPVNAKDVNVSEVINNAINQVKTLAAEKNIRVKTLYRAKSVNSDEDLLLRITSNLLSNAIKVSPEGSEVIIEAKDNNANNVEFNIQDQGPGITEGMEKMLFEKYTQLEAKKRGAFTGSGLGLAFCKTAVEAHGGKIRIENKKNGGAKVTFTLPKTVSI